MQAKRNKDLKKRKQFYFLNSYQRLLKVLVHFSCLDIQIYLYKKLKYKVCITSFKTRIRNFCVLSKRSRSVSRNFKVSRICLKNLGNELFFGLRKASW